MSLFDINNENILYPGMEVGDNTYIASIIDDVVTIKTDKPYGISYLDSKYFKYLTDYKKVFSEDNIFVGCDDEVNLYGLIIESKFHVGVMTRDNFNEIRTGSGLYKTTFNILKNGTIRCCTFCSNCKKLQNINVNFSPTLSGSVTKYNFTESIIEPVIFDNCKITGLNELNLSNPYIYITEKILQKLSPKTMQEELGIPFDDTIENIYVYRCDLIDSDGPLDQWTKLYRFYKGIKGDIVKLEKEFWVFEDLLDTLNRNYQKLMFLQDISRCSSTSE